MNIKPTTTYWGMMLKTVAMMLLMEINGINADK